jgi:hypothetical protein
MQALLLGLLVALIAVFAGEKGGRVNQAFGGDKQTKAVACEVRLIKGIDVGDFPDDIHSHAALGEFFSESKRAFQDLVPRRMALLSRAESEAALLPFKRPFRVLPFTSAIKDNVEFVDDPLGRTLPEVPVTYRDSGFALIVINLLKADSGHMDIGPKLPLSDFTAYGNSIVRSLRGKAGFFHRTSSVVERTSDKDDARHAYQHLPKCEVSLFSGSVGCRPLRFQTGFLTLLTIPSALAFFRIFYDPNLKWLPLPDSWAAAGCPGAIWGLCSNL